MLASRFTSALVYAAELHATQLRKGTATPYIGHLLGVAAIVIEAGASEDEAIAALLHDAIEDQGGDATRQEIRRRFGDAVTAIVDGCTDTDVEPKPPWRARKEAYLAHLRHADAAVRLVSAADKLFNVRSLVSDYRQLGDALWDRFNGGKQGTLWYYRSLADILTAAGPSPLVEELARQVAELERLVEASP